MLKLGMVLSLVLGLNACTEADLASRNLSKAAEEFAVTRRIVFYNGITDSYILVIEGLCSIFIDQPGHLSVTCKTQRDRYIKHYLGLSDNVTYFAEQLQGVRVDTDHYKVIFKPSAIIPDIDIK